MILRKSSFKSGSKRIDQFDKARYDPTTSSLYVCSKIRLQAFEQPDGSSCPLIADDNSMPTSTKCRWVIGSWQKMILFLLTCEMNCFIFSLSDICYIKEGLPSDVSTGDQALFTPQESPLFLISPFQGILVVFVEQYPFVSFQETDIWVQRYLFSCKIHLIK